MASSGIPRADSHCKVCWDHDFPPHFFMGHRPTLNGVAVCPILYTAVCTHPTCPQFQRQGFKNGHLPSHCPTAAQEHHERLVTPKIQALVRGHLERQRLARVEKTYEAALTGWSGSSPSVTETVLVGDIVCPRVGVQLVSPHLVTPEQTVPPEQSNVSENGDKLRKYHWGGHPVHTDQWWVSEEENQRAKEDNFNRWMTLHRITNSADSIWGNC